MTGTLVLLRHGVSVPDLAPPDGLIESALYNIAANGWLGVDLFFVLSGYLLSSQILRDCQSPLGFDRLNFLVRRALRTMPAFLLVLLLLWSGFLSKSLQTGGVRELHTLAVHDPV